MGKSFIDKVLEMPEVKAQRDELMQAGRRLKASDERDRREDILTRALWESVRDMRRYAWTGTRTGTRTGSWTGGQDHGQEGGQDPGHLSGHMSTILSGQESEQKDGQDSGQEGGQFYGQIITLKFFMNNPKIFISLPGLSEKTGLPYGTIRRHIRKMEKHGCLTSKKHSEFGVRGKYYVADTEKCGQYLGQLRGQDSGQDHGQDDGQLISSYGAIEDSSSYSYKNSVLHPVLRDKFSFRQSHIDQVVSRRKEKGISLDDLQDSLWVIAELLQDTKYLREQGIEKPRAYFLKALENGPVDLPEGYKTVYERRREKQKHRIEAARKEKFLAWKESLGKDELEKICSQGRGPREQWLWYWFTKYVDQ